jgi:hypothetical protein
MYKPLVQEGARTLDQRSYELSNHLGNVLAVITDNIHFRNTLECIKQDTSI